MRACPSFWVEQGGCRKRVAAGGGRGCGWRREGLWLEEGGVAGGGGGGGRCSCERSCLWWMWGAIDSTGRKVKGVLQSSRERVVAKQNKKSVRSCGCVHPKGPTDSIFAEVRNCIIQQNDVLCFFSQQWQQVTMLQSGRRIFPEPNFSCFILLGAEPQPQCPAPKRNASTPTVPTHTLDRSTAFAIFRFSNFATQKEYSSSVSTLPPPRGCRGGPLALPTRSCCNPAQRRAAPAHAAAASN
jgi:hypothetical protein